jgi:hypothetical protein
MGQSSRTAFTAGTVARSHRPANRLVPLYFEIKRRIRAAMIVPLDYVRRMLARRSAFIWGAAPDDGSAHRLIVERG